MSERFYWRARLKSGAPYIALCTWWGQPIMDGEELDRHMRWQCLVSNETTSRMVLMGDSVPIDVDGISLRNIESISKGDYDFMRSHSAWAVEHRPDLPEAAPRSKIDWNRLKPVF